MRATELFMPTLKEDPADAEAISHKLMVRGGFVRQFASGIYIMLPLGWRVMQRILAIVREEMNGIGANELSMPTLHPADVWQATGRYDAIGGEMFIGRRTVESHLYNVYRKLGVKNRLQMARRAAAEMERRDGNPAGPTRST